MPEEVQLCESRGWCPAFLWDAHCKFMQKAIIGTKAGMTQIYEEGRVIPVTIITAAPCTVLQVRTNEKDGYEAIQVGSGPIEKKGKMRKSKNGKQFRHIAEFRGLQGEAGSAIDASVFQAGDRVVVSAMSKGKGFQGAVKRWGFSGRNATHGVKHEERTIGSIGSTGPMRVVKGKKMPGRMGYDRTTFRSVKVAAVDSAANTIALKGAVPGPNGGVVKIWSA